MNCQEAVNEGIAAFHRATSNMLASRTIFILSVLDVTPRAKVAKALADVDPKGKTPSDSTVRREIIRTTLKMGLKELPTGEKGGRPSFETCDAYKREHCGEWIAANGGMPRLEQLADPDWDLKPYPPAISSTRPHRVAETATATMLGSHAPTVSKTKKLPLHEPFPPATSEESAQAVTHDKDCGNPERLPDAEPSNCDEVELLDAVPEMPSPFKLTWNDPWEKTWKDEFEHLKDAAKLSIPESDRKMKELSLRLPRDHWVCKALLLHAQAHGIPFDPSHYKRYQGTIREHYKKLLKQYWNSRS